MRSPSLTVHAKLISGLFWSVFTAILLSTYAVIAEEKSTGPAKTTLVSASKVDFFKLLDLTENDINHTKRIPENTLPPPTSEQIANALKPTPVPPIPPKPATPSATTTASATKTPAEAKKPGDDVAGGMKAAEALTGKSATASATKTPAEAKKPGDDVAGGMKAAEALTGKSATASATKTPVVSKQPGDDVAGGMKAAEALLGKDAKGNSKTDAKAPATAVKLVMPTTPEEKAAAKEQPPTVTPAPRKVAPLNTQPAKKAAASPSTSATPKKDKPQEDVGAPVPTKKAAASPSTPAPTKKNKPQEDVGAPVPAKNLAPATDDAPPATPKKTKPKPLLNRIFKF